MPRRLTTAVIALLAVLCCAGATLAVSPEFVATSLDGGQISGDLLAWQPERLVLQVHGENVELPTEQLLKVRLVDAPKKMTEPSSYVELTDGTRLSLRGYSVSRQEATIDTPLAEEPLTLATEQVRVVQFSPRARDDSVFWSQLAAARLLGDALVVQQSDAGAVEHLFGVLGNVSPQEIHFRWDGEDIPVKRTKVVALAYFHRKSPQGRPPRSWLSTTSGGRLPVAEMTCDVAHQTLRVTTVGGIPLAVPLDSLLEADYSAGKLTYLSDLEPLVVQWTPRIDLPASAELVRGYGLPRSDQSFSGSSLSLFWPAVGTLGPGTTKDYAKGLALRSRTVLEYRIPEGMTRFAATVGIDPTTRGQGNVTLEISADRKLLWQGEIDGSDAPVQLDVPLSEARRLRLLVDYGGNLDYGDRLHLVDARMTK